MEGRRALALVVLAMAAASAAVAADEPDEQVQAGRRTYISNCQRCHGINLATNGIGFDLRTFPSDGKERFVRSVTQGKGAMPAWGGILKPDQIDLVWAYIGSVNGWPK